MNAAISVVVAARKRKLAAPRTDAKSSAAPVLISPVTSGRPAVRVIC